MPLKGSGWVGYQQCGWFCCQNHFESWRKKNNQNPDRRGDNTEFPLNNPVTNPGKRGGNNKENGTGNNNSDNSRFGSDNHSHGNSGQGDNNFNFSLVEIQVKSEQEIEKALKDSSISEAELDKGLWGGKSNWKEFLKELDTPEKVAEFTDKMKQNILKKKLEKLANKTRTQDKKPKNDWILPAIMLSIFAFLALILIIVIRKRKHTHTHTEREREREREF